MTAVEAKGVPAMSFSAAQVEQFCCIDLMRAEVRGQMSTASGGVWVGSQEHGGCSSLPVFRPESTGGDS